MTDEDALGSVIAAVEAGTGLRVALRRLTATDVHVELLDGDDDRHSWYECDSIVDNLEGSDAAAWKPVVTSYLKRLIDLV